MVDPAVYPEESQTSVQSLLQVRELTIGYRTQDRGLTMALEGATFHISAGEAAGLLGESGCGKTTLGQALLGLLPPSGSVVRGSIVFCGKNLVGLGDQALQEVRGAGISMVYQEPGASLNPVLQIGDQITEVIRAHHRFSRDQAQEIANVLLGQVGFPWQTRIAEAYPHQLSGGQQQRIAIAQAIACRPELIIADEPTTALDRQTQIEILDLLTNLRKKMRLALLLISHDFSVLRRAVDRVMVMRDGHIVQRGTTQEIADSLDGYTQSLLSCPPAAVRRKNCGPVLVAKWRESGDNTACGQIQSGKAPRCDCPTHAEPAGKTAGDYSRLNFLTKPDDSGSEKSEPLLFASNLQKSYLQGRWPSANRRRVEALYGVELKVDAGSALAVVGPSGSGKSTLARCLACLETPDCGEIWFEGIDLAALPTRQLVPLRRQIQMIFQDPGSSLNPRFSAIELISEPLLIDPERTRHECRDRALALMEQVGLRPDWGNRLPHQFSAGQRRRLAIARALSVEPKLLILDEALAGLDRPIQAQIADLLLELQDSLSLTYVHISHDLELVARLADRVVVLHQGQVVDTTNTQELLAESRGVEARSPMDARWELVGLQRQLA
jgi:peptide/nickel transport system ATP-binding protein